MSAAPGLRTVHHHRGRRYSSIPTRHNTNASEHIKITVSKDTAERNYDLGGDGDCYYSFVLSAWSLIKVITYIV